MAFATGIDVTNPLVVTERLLASLKNCKQLQENKDMFYDKLPHVEKIPFLGRFLKKQLETMRLNKMLSKTAKEFGSNVKVMVEKFKKEEISLPEFNNMLLNTAGKFKGLIEKAHDDGHKLTGDFRAVLLILHRINSFLLGDLQTQSADGDYDIEKFFNEG